MLVITRWLSAEYSAWWALVAITMTKSKDKVNQHSLHRSYNNNKASNQRYNSYICNFCCFSVWKPTCRPVCCLPSLYLPHATETVSVQTEVEGREFFFYLVLQSIHLKCAPESIIFLPSCRINERRFQSGKVSTHPPGNLHEIPEQKPSLVCILIINTHIMGPGWQLYLFSSNSEVGTLCMWSFPHPFWCQMQTHAVQEQYISCSTS